MPKPHKTALMPVGTVIEHDGTRYCKTHESRREPFPWTTELGGEYGDERMAHLLDDGGQVVEIPHELKTAKDLPAGAEVRTGWTTWTKGTDGSWTNQWWENTATDAEIDRLLADGASVTRVPTGPTKEK